MMIMKVPIKINVIFKNLTSGECPAALLLAPHCLHLLHITGLTALLGEDHPSWRSFDTKVYSSRWWRWWWWWRWWGWWWWWCIASPVVMVVLMLMLLLKPMIEMVNILHVCILVAYSLPPWITCCISINSEICVFQGPGLWRLALSFAIWWLCCPWTPGSTASGQPRSGREYF